MSRAERFDRADFEVRYAEPVPAAGAGTDAIAEREETAPVASAPAQLISPPVRSGHPATRPRRAIWPIAQGHIHRVGESVLADRNGQGRPHKGVDIFADAGTEIVAARGGQVLRVIDGRQTKSASQQRAGLFIDIRGGDSLVYRYLHLGDARVEPGASVKQGTVLGTVAAPHTSGLADATHLHFEIRQADYERTRQDYGAPIDPRRVLPPLQA